MNSSSTHERIAIVDLADDLQVRKQSIFKVVRRLGIRPTQRREPSRGNQNVATVTPHEASAIRAEIVKSSGTPGADSGLALVGPAVYYSDDVGFSTSSNWSQNMIPDASRWASRVISKDDYGNTAAPRRSLSTYVAFRPSASGSERRLTV